MKRCPCCGYLTIDDSYDKLVELKESEWLQELKHVNEENFNDWSPKHFAIYLYGDAMYQFIAKECEVDYEKCYQRLFKKNIQRVSGLL